VRAAFLQGVRNL